MPQHCSLNTTPHRRSRTRGSLRMVLATLVFPLLLAPPLQAQHDDPDKMAEHMALMNLLPPEQATVTAQGNGAWFNGSTWSTGQVPGTNARVHIPSGVTVTYNGAADTRLRIVRVDGTLRFNPYVNTRMVVDTLITTMGSTLEIGTADNPIDDNRSARIVIGPVYASQEPIDTNWDWHQLSRGVVTHGTVRIHGEVKSTFHRVTVDPRADDTSVTVLGSPTNWEPGDEIVITGTRHVRDSGLNQDRTWNGTEDEVRVITAVSGNTVSFSDPLQYDHSGAGFDITGQPLRAYVANLTRNVVIETEDPENTPTQQRGHVMFMHNPDVDVRYAQFRELGRTDKSTYLDDILVDENGHRILDAQGNPQPGPRTNIRGRYAFHFHRTGAMDANAAPAVAWGNAVIGGPGWGFVHHDSNADFIENVSFDVFAAHFVTETGNELGRWERNIAIRSRALGNGTVHGVKDGQGYNNHDNGRPGVGFWFQGRVVTCKNNVAAGQRRVGFAYLLRGVDQLNVLAEALDFPQIANGRETIRPDIPEIHGFVDNETLGSEVGLVVIKSNSNQQHEVRSLIDEFSAWNVRYGFQTEYTSHYTFRDLTLIGDTSHPGDPRGRVGAEFAQALFDMYISNAEISQFEKGFYYEDRNDLNRIPDWAEESIGLIDTQFFNCDENIFHKNDNIEEIQVLDSEQLSAQPLILLEDQFPVIGPDDMILVSGTILDSVGSKRYEDVLSSAELRGIAAKDGYYTLNGVPFVAYEDVLMDRHSGESVINTYLIDVSNHASVITNATHNGTWPGGVPAPNDPPTVSINAPASGTVGTPVTINLNASDVDGVAAVDVLGNRVTLGAATQGSGNSWSFQWTPPRSGTFQLQARALDNQGMQALSAEDTVTINAAPPGNGGSNPVIDTSFDNGLTVASGSWMNSNDPSEVGVGWQVQAADGPWTYDAAGGFATNSGSGAPAMAQIIHDQGQTTGLQNVSFRLANQFPGNIVEFYIWGVNEAFGVSLYERVGPRTSAGNIADGGVDGAELLADRDLNDGNDLGDLDEPDFVTVSYDNASGADNRVNFGTGYEYLVVLFYVKGATGDGEYVRVDDVVIGGDAPDPDPDPDPEPEPGTNPALNQPAKWGNQSRTWSNGFDASVVVDGDSGTSKGTWTGTQHTYQWFAVDLGSPQSINQVKMLWGGNNHQAVDYEIQGSGDGDSWTTIEPVTNNFALETDDTVNATIRFVRIKVNESGQAPTNPTRVILHELEIYGGAGTLPPPDDVPGNFRVTATTGTSVTLAWIDNATEEIGFNINRSESPAFTGGVTWLWSNPDTTTFTDTNVQPNKTYYYRIRASYGGGKASDWAETEVAETN